MRTRRTGAGLASIREFASGSNLDFAGPRSGRYSWARHYHPSLARFISEDPIGFAGGDPNLYAYVFNNPIGLRDPSGMVVDPISWTAAAIMCGGGATVGMSVVVLSGRKPTVENLAAGAAIGCGTGMLLLVSWIAAGGAAIAGTVPVAIETAGAGAATVKGLEAVMRSDPRTFQRFLESLEGQAARAKGATRTVEETRRILDEALRRGYTVSRGIETNWAGGRHIHLRPPVGPEFHFPLPSSLTP